MKSDHSQQKDKGLSLLQGLPIDVQDPLKVDLAFLEETEATFQFEAIQGACIYCPDQEVLENYIERVLRFASDWSYTREKINQEFLAMMESQGEGQPSGEVPHT